MVPEPATQEDSLVGHLLVPLADVEDARATAESLAAIDPEHVTILYVVEKGAGAPDKTPVEQSESIAADTFAAFNETIALPDVDEEIAYGSDIVAEVIEVAADIDASAIAFRPRGGSRVVQFLAGDRALRLITESDRPVIALPEVEK